MFEFVSHRDAMVETEKAYGFRYEGIGYGNDGIQWLPKSQTEHGAPWKGYAPGA